MKKFEKVLVANRGEIAQRIIKALKELGIKTIAVYSNVDKDAPYVRLADNRVCLGDAKDSYLNTYKLISAATAYKVDAIHPGIGFMAESGEFAELCNQCNIVFIGPGYDLINAMGNKSRAKQIARECHIPIIEGSEEPVADIEECEEFGEKAGYPILLKATYGGGGKGIRIVNRKEELSDCYELCVKEAKTAFNNGELLVEKAVQNFKHFEVQILGDTQGNIIHLGDRECTIQRSNQKVIEEARCQNISEDLRQRIYDDALKIAKYIHYVGPGTVEFLVQNNEKYYFMEINTRLQVEHTITELITGIDIVKEQIKIFEGCKLELSQRDIKFDGYALQCRILAENMTQGGFPSLGKITKWNMPGGLDVRVDNGYGCGNKVTPYYDSLIAKISCRASNKEQAVKKMLVSLEETEIEGIKTNVEFLKYILKKDEFLSGDYTEKFMGKAVDRYNKEYKY
ncbi:acetyl-CoA carboxylase biotin carboxylase subunit [Lacrimispora sp. 38-1]|uniref:acetyl-CoA carboxylase biotin carboxylase subunit n=1 Tax=Lacrimispora sp. 38-1 TaxID=3125778 RepID=UPI003CEE1067